MPLDRIDGEMLLDNSVDAVKLSFTPGDMLKAIYDTDNDGKVDAAEVADNVAWTGVTGKPSIFASDESEVTVDNGRFTSFTPGAGGRLEQTLDGIDTALGAITGLSTGNITVTNSSTNYASLGATADVGGAQIFYYIKRGSDYETGSMMLMSDGSSTVEVALMPSFTPAFTAAAAGVTFAGRINAGNVELSITADSSGDDAQVRLAWIPFAELT